MSFRSVDSARAIAEVKNGIVKIKCNLNLLDGLAVEAVSEVNFRATGLRKRGSQQRWIQLTASHPQVGCLSKGAFPRNASCWIVRFGQVNQFRQRIRLRRIYGESQVRN